MRIQEINTNNVSDHSNFYEMPRPPWLLCSLEEITWRFRKDVGSYSSSHYTFSWQWPESTEIDTGHHAYWTIIGQKICYQYMESEATPCSNTNSLISMARNLRPLIFWIALERHRSSLSEITLSDVEAYENYLKTIEISRSHVASRLLSFRLFWTLRSDLRDGMLFDPYPFHGDIARKAKKLGHRNEHTPTIAPTNLFILINHALEVLDTADIWITRSNAYLDYLKDRNGKYSRSQTRRQWIASNISPLDLRHNTELIYGSAIALFLMLEASRKHQLAEFLVSSLAGLSDNPPTLMGRVRKTASSRGGKITKDPVPPELERALLVVRDLTRITRDRFGGEHLFISASINSDRAIDPTRPLDSGGIYRLLDKLATSAGLSIEVRPHMFRRAFALLYTWRYEVGDLLHLSRMLNHKNLEFTRSYTNQEDLREFSPQAEKELSFRIMEDALLGLRTAAGGFGEHLKKLVRRVSGMVTLVTPQMAAPFLQRLIVNEGLRLIPSSHGYCAMSPRRARYSKCATELAAPDLANRTHSHCLHCPNYFVHEGFTKYWLNRKDAHETVLKHSEIDILRQVATDAISECEKVIRWLTK